MSEAPLKIILLCESASRFEPWMARLAQRIAASEKLHLVGLLESDAVPKKAGGSVLFRAWWALEKRLAAKPAGFADTHFQSIIGALPKLLASDTSAVSKLQPDVVIDLTRGMGRGMSAENIPLGVWFLDTLVPFAGGPAFEAISGSAPITQVNLRRYTSASDASSQIALAALNTKLLASLNFLFACEKSVTLILRELHRAQRGENFESSPFPPPPTPRPPGFGHAVKYITGAIGNLSKRVFEKIGIKLGLRPGMFFLKTGAGEPLSIDPTVMQTHATPVNEYYADPFLWEHDGKLYCFFEVYDYSAGRGHISAGELKDGELVNVKVALKCDYHLSFPFLFERGSELMMMPETCAANRIETWRCVNFPDEWERNRTVLDDVVAADSSLVNIDDEWWLFTNISTDPFGEMNSELHIYKTDGPELTTLIPHPLNPVVFDTRTARNGGRVIEHKGRFLRMSQDNSHGLYGYALNIMEIEHISMQDYREREVKKIRPDQEKGIIGSHHLDHRSGVSVIDIRKRLGRRRG